MWSGYTPPGPSIGTVTKPSGTVALIESTTNWTQQASGYGYDDSGNLRALNSSGIRGAQHFRHTMEMNVLFADGHVASEHPGAMVKLGICRRNQ
jgi:prepilin-type processing-associated H-X9-DG protein